jgi:hypothetical protein
MRLTSRQESLSAASTGLPYIVQQDDRGCVQGFVQEWARPRLDKDS